MTFYIMRVIESMVQMKIDEEGQVGVVGDHSWIETEFEWEVDRRRIKKGKKQTWRINEKTDWGKYEVRLQEEMKEWERVMDEEEVQDADFAMEMYERLIEGTKKVAKEVVGVVSGKRKYTNVKGKAVKNMRAARARWRRAEVRNKREAERVARWYMEKKRVAEREIKKAAEKRRRKWWWRIMMEGGTSSSSLWSKMTGGKMEINALKVGEEVVTEKQKIMQTVEAHFKRLGAGQVSEEGGREERNEDGGEERSITEEVSIKEMGRTVRKLKNRKAMGADNMVNELMKYGGECGVRVYAKMFNMFLKVGCTPGSWNEETVSLLHKGGEKKVIDNYRGIAISSIVGKVFARILAARLLGVSEEEGWLPEEQAAFRPGRGVNDHLCVLNMLMRRTRKARGKMMLGFLDVRKAYDTVDREKLWHKLRGLGLDERSVEAVKGLYVGHRRRIKVAGGETEWIRCVQGLRQGCPMSPILFALFTADLPGVVKEQGGGVELQGEKVSMMMYADDMVIVTKREDQLGRMMGALITELNERGLRVNAKKSAVMRVGFWPEREYDDYRWQVTNGEEEVEEIGEVDTYKYLGMIIDRGGRGRGFQKEQMTKVHKQTCIMMAKAGQAEDRFMAGRAVWEMKVKRGMVWGAGVYTYTNQWIQSMERLQRRVAKWLMKGSRTASATALSGELGWRRVVDELAIERLCWWARCMKMEDGRWPKKAVEEMINETEKFPWAVQVQTDMQEYGVGEEVLDVINTSKKIVKIVSTAVWKEFGMGVKRAVRMAHNPVEVDGKCAKYMDGSEEAVNFCRVRTDDVWGVVGEEEMEKCNGCGEEVECVWDHIVRECGSVEEVRERVIREQGRGEDREVEEGNEEIWSCRGIRVKDKEVNLGMGRIVGAWRAKWRKRGDKRME